ncbi:MAG: hypothetical protein R3212_13640, partial [Xanthomonadales bacterium]|nr:hypothetical protein [Xanthomonadales bacterium]
NDLSEAQQLAERVTERAPRFAPGWNRLAAIHGRRLIGRDADYPHPPQEALAIMYQAVERALDIDPASAEAYANLGGIAWVFENDVRKAAPLIERAVSLAPWHLDIVSFAADFAKSIGRVEEALELEALIVRRDPLCEPCRLRLAQSFLLANRPAEANRELRLLQSSSDFTTWQRGVALVLMQRPEDALELFDAMEAGSALKLQGHIMATCRGDRGMQAGASMEELRRTVGPADPLLVGKTMAYCGNVDEAFDWLERSVSSRPLLLQNEYLDPLFNPLRDDPRWLELLGRIDRAPGQIRDIPFSLEQARARLD